MRRLHVNSSLPRAGSELMQCLLMQHPEVYASATSPVLEYWYGAMKNYDLAEVKSQPVDMMERAFTSFCRRGTIGYYESITDRAVIVDKSRGWLEYAELLWQIFPRAKIVSMVRDVQGILESLDRIYRKNVGHPETRDLPKSQDDRFNYWLAKGSRPLGLALERLRERQQLGPDDRIKYVKYEDLVATPVEVMREVFTFIEVDPIEIDRLNIKKQVIEDDIHYGIFGNHSVRSIISRNEQ